MNSGSAIETWAVKAANAHNGYLDMALSAGLPGLALFLVWFVVQPARDLARAAAAGADPLLSTFFVRIWVYAMLTGCLENPYFVGGGPIWITTLMAVLGLRLQARAVLVADDRSAAPPSGRG
jgi:O-antigen ligase